MWASSCVGFFGGGEGEGGGGLGSGQDSVFAVIGIFVIL